MVNFIFDACQAGLWSTLRQFLLQRQPQAQNGVPCAKGQDARPRSNSRFHCCFDPSRNCHLNLPPRDFLVSCGEASAPRVLPARARSSLGETLRRLLRGTRDEAWPDTAQSCLCLHLLSRPLSAQRTFRGAALCRALSSPDEMLPDS